VLCPFSTSSINCVFLAVINVVFQYFLDHYSRKQGEKEDRKLLVKQERHDQKGKTAGEFLNEWRIQELSP
jgi:hypothetical protein